MKNERILFCDIDDVLINSSTYIQNYVDNNTIFKTDVLKIIEQLKRNCQYYADMVFEECKTAFRDRRIPDLNKFPNMNVDLKNIDFNSLDEDMADKLYVKPVENAREYLRIADLILNEFLEERDMFLELDNLPLNQGKNYDYKLEKQNIERFKETIRKNYADIQNINRFCLNKACEISLNAKKNGTFPNYGALVKMDNNDIIRTNTVNKDSDYYLFEKPCIDVEKCLKYSIIDYALKNFDINEEVSKEIVDYNYIYTTDHANYEAVLAIKKELLSGRIDRLCFITHHNGVREEEAKKAFIKKLFPHADFLGLRFHSEEHYLKRRYRSSKYDKATIFYATDPSNMILLDDSKDNCNDWYKKGGQVIIYRKITDAEKTSTIEDFGYPRITDFDQLESKIANISNIEKQKVKRIEVK